MACKGDIIYKLIWMKFLSMLSMYVQSCTNRHFHWTYCGFNTKSYCSDVCGYYLCPQTLAEICRNMGIWCIFRAVAAREKYPGFILLHCSISQWHYWVTASITIKITVKIRCQWYAQHDNIMFKTAMERAPHHSAITHHTDTLAGQLACNSLITRDQGAIYWHWLTHWGRDKMDAISQTPFSNAFALMKIFEFQLEFHWSLFLRVQLTIFQHCFR